MSIVASIALILAVGAAITLMARVSIGKHVRFGKGWHRPIGGPPEEHRALFADALKQVRDLELARDGYYECNDGDGYTRVLLCATNSDENIWARFEPTGSQNVPLQLTAHSVLDDGSLLLTTFPHIKPPLPLPAEMRWSEHYYASAQEAMAHHRQELESANAPPIDVNEIFELVREVHAEMTGYWTKKGWLAEADGQLRLTLRGIVRAGSALQRYAHPTANRPNETASREEE